MIEWVVLVWTVACPWVPSSFRGIQDCPDGNVQRFFISSTTAKFDQKWNSLSGKEREMARVFKGKEYQVRPFFELQGKKYPVKLKEGVPSWQWELVLRDLEYTSADPDTEESTRELANETIKSIRTLLQNRAFDSKIEAIEKNVDKNT